MPSRELSRAEIAALWCDPELPRSTAAYRLGLTVNQLRKRARKLGLPMRDSVDKRSGQRLISDEAVRRLWARADLTRVEQAQQAGVTVNYLTEQARRLGLPMRCEPRDKRIPAARIREVWMNPDLSGKEAAALVGLTRTNLWLRAKSLGLPPRKQGTRYAIRAGSEKAQLFVSMWNAHVSAQDMAEEFEVHPQTISSYARRFGLSKRTHPGRLISISQYRAQKREEAMRRAMASSAKQTNLALRRFGQEDYCILPCVSDERHGPRLVRYA